MYVTWQVMGLRVMSERQSICGLYFWNYCSIPLFAVAVEPYMKRLSFCVGLGGKNGKQLPLHAPYSL